jgi:tetratricopeptide (TPR) repeat protein
MRAPAKAARLLAALLLAAAAGTPWARATADPFYLDLLRDGIQSYDRAEYPTAAKRLRLACFGLLDEPVALAACLTRLGLAEAAAGDAEGFRETFRRIVEVEERFGAWSKAELPPETRDAFEQRAIAAIPAATLEGIAAFKPLLARKLEAQIAALPPRERRRELEQRLAREPKGVAWNVLLADLDLSEGKTAPGLARAEQAAALAPRDPQALCVRGLARAMGSRCREAVADLEPCYLCGREVRYATALLGCRVELGQWRQADQQVRALPPGFKSDRKLAALAQQVAKHPAIDSAPAGGGGAAGGGTAAANAPPPPASVPARSDPARAAAEKAAAEKPGTAGGRKASPAAGAKPVPDGRAQPVPDGRGQAALDGRGQPAPDGRAADGGQAGTTSPAATAAARPLSTAERETMARSERLLTANGTSDLREALRLARQLADAHPDSKEAQYLAGEAAYRNSRWTEAAAYFRRGGTPGDDHPELLFYMAVAFYEVGDQPGAASALRRSLPNLQKTPYVESYAKRILGQ